ncbi:MAG TPA: hypothetical protein VFL58_02420 [Gaiellaceae bacterium]|nr:hypothetical protein [Gaiellaceae bacterium]
MNETHRRSKRRWSSTHPAVEEALIVHEVDLIDVGVLKIIGKKVQLVPVVAERPVLPTLPRKIPDEEVDRLTYPQRPSHADTCSVIGSF